jgi:aryl-alcohol dehydrogenase-like predicted oxidoreductase
MINKLILGTVQLGLDYGINNQQGKPSQQQAFKILETAYNSGVSTLDTAEAYGDSQLVIGQFLKTHPEKQFKIITKLAATSTVKPSNLLLQIEKNCNILHVEKLHGYMFHNYQSFKEKQNLYDKFLLAKENKLISKAGISLYTNSEVEDVINNFSGFDFIQIPFNLFDNATKRKEILDQAKSKNIEVHTRSVFLQGLFFKQPEELPLKLKTLKGNLEILDILKQKYNLNTLTLALQYVLQKYYIDNVLIGVETAEQLKLNIKSAEKHVKIPHIEIDDINIITDELLNPSNWN